MLAILTGGYRVRASPCIGSGQLEWRAVRDMIDDN